MPEKTFHSLTLPGMDTARVPLTAIEFSPYTNYNVRDYCTYQGKLYRCITEHSATAWNASHFEETNIDNELDGKLSIPMSQAAAPSNPRVGDLWIDSEDNSPIYNVDATPTANSTNAVSSGGVKTALDTMYSQKANRELFSGDYSTSATYTVGQLVMRGNYFYRCIVAITSPEKWNASHWVATNLNTEFQSRQNQMTNVIEVPVDSPTITPVTNTIYKCGELTSLTISNAPLTGEYSIIFTSGSPATTVSGMISSILGLADFEPEENKIYEINVFDNRAVIGVWDVPVVFEK